MRASSWALAPILLVLACGDTEGDGPLTAPASFHATPGRGTVALSWKNADDAGTETAIVRFDVATAQALPDEVALEVGRTFPSAVVLYVGDDESFVDATLDRCTSYLYRAFTVGGAGERAGTKPVDVHAGSTITPATAPPTSLEATFVDGGVHLSWEAPGAETDHVRIVRREGAPVSNPDDGDVIATLPSGAELFDPIGGMGAAPPLEPGATYHYAAYACDACERCETVGAHASASTPVALGDAPTDLVVDPDGATVDFRWKAPGLGGTATMRLLAREGAPVDGADDADAEVLYEGTEAEARIATTTFLPDVAPFAGDYHFAVFACAGDTCGDGAVAEHAFTLRETMRGGGYVVYFAHAEAGICVDRTDLGTAAETSTPDWWKSCERSCDVATAEQLDAAGYDDAQRAGLSLRNVGIPFDTVLTSEYCRAVETAQRLEILPNADIETRTELTPFVYGDDDARCEATLDLIAGAALGAPDRNAAIIGHGALPDSCADLDALAPGEAAVIRPTEDGPVIVGAILPDDWAELP